MNTTYLTEWTVLELGEGDPSKSISSPGHLFSSGILGTPWYPSKQISEEDEVCVPEVQAVVLLFCSAPFF